MGKAGMRNAPKCPYCGVEMSDAGNNSYRWMMCPLCLSGSPRRPIDPHDGADAIKIATAKARDFARDSFHKYHNPDDMDEIDTLRNRVENLTLYLTKAFYHVNWLETFMRTNFSGLPGYTSNNKE